MQSARAIKPRSWQRKQQPVPLTLVKTDKVIGYVRVSDPKQASEGISLEEQAKAIENHCKRQGYELVAIFIEPGISGGKYAERPAFLKAITYLQVQDVKALIVNKFDRFFRDTMGDVIRKKLHRHGKMIESVQEQIDLNDPAGEAHFQMNMVFAEWERKTIFKRTWAIRMAKVERGGWIGHRVPFGWRAAYTEDMLSTLVPVPEEQYVITTIHRLHKWAGLKQRDIADYLNRKMEEDPVRWGPKTSKELKKPRRTPYMIKRSGLWSQSTIWKILNNYYPYRCQQLSSEN